MEGKAIADKEKIFVGDTFPVAYEMRKPDTVDTRNTLGLPAQPSSAYARLYDRQIGDFLPIGGTGVFQVPVTIEPKTGDLKTDRGAILKYTVPTTFTQNPGTYTLWITAVFADGAILTEDRPFQVLEPR